MNTFDGVFLVIVGISIYIAIRLTNNWCKYQNMNDKERELHMLKQLKKKYPKEYAVSEVHE